MIIQVGELGLFYTFQSYTLRDVGQGPRIIFYISTLVNYDHEAIRVVLQIHCQV